MIRVGTSGFHYADWYGVFYPPDLDRQEMLTYYARHFDLVELDYTYYQMPNARSLAAMAAKTPPGFLFALKLYREFTHRPDLTGRELDRLAGEFKEALAPLREAGKLACLLAQFPWRFRPKAENTEYLAVLREVLADLPLVIEFRTADWVRKEIFDFLTDFNLGFCVVDEPRLPGLLPPVVRATSDLGYVRFHGRNAAKWWQHNAAGERYDYLYSEEELAEWVPRLRELERQTSSTFVFMNNCHAGHAVRNALLLKTMLSGNS